MVKGSIAYHGPVESHEVDTLRERIAELEARNAQLEAIREAGLAYFRSQGGHPAVSKHGCARCRFAKALAEAEEDDG